MIFRILPALGALALTLPAVAAEPEGKPAAAAPARDYAANSASKVFTGTFGGRTVRYSAAVQEQVLKGDDGTPKAAIVTTAYVATPGDPSRPVTFLFNGGPGSGSVWLQMGAFGPKRVAIPSDARDDGAPPYPLVDNPDSLLDVTDLVFIDPVGTGFSRALVDDKKATELFYSTNADIHYLSRIVYDWLVANGRLQSPKYLVGESYGGFRAAKVADRRGCAHALVDRGEPALAARVDLDHAHQPFGAGGQLLREQRGSHSGREAPADSGSRRAAHWGEALRHRRGHRLHRAARRHGS